MLLFKKFDFHSYILVRNFYLGRTYPSHFLRSLAKKKDTTLLNISNNVVHYQINIKMIDL
ncbi:hypothetical protein BpHYR1_018927 [Brachionus plicatilis]|uniref:Uncharacterized protein n=1 Tax=Brachionus plicatilis TaxID=10195 RepID=A0A3M7S6Y1_BRAPC|nr:hypothetical protein BpHYR1_018927 [Brachionus plicatilis]